MNAAQVATAVIAGLALIVSIVVGTLTLRRSRRAIDVSEASSASAARSAAASERSAVAAEANAAIAARNEQRVVEQQHDAVGPRFDPEDTIADDRTAEVRIKVVGGPRKMVVTVRPDSVPWCRGVSTGTSTDPADAVIFPPVAPGATLTMTVHLTTDLWSGHERDGHPLPLLLDVESREPGGVPERTWQRAAQVILRPPPPPPMVAWIGPDDRLPDDW